MSLEIKHIAKNKSLLNKSWKLKTFDDRDAIFLSQQFNLKFIIAKLLSIRGIEKESVENFLNPNLNFDIPSPTKLLDIEKATKRVIEAINKKQRIGIIADYDVDGSTSASILYSYTSFSICIFLMSNFSIILAKNALFTGDFSYNFT